MIAKTRGMPVAVVVAVAIVDGSSVAQWTDVSNDVLREPETISKGLAWGDLDGDDDLDLVWVNANGENRVVRNDGGDVWTDVTPATLLVPLNVNQPVLGDYDNDGDLDLFLAIFSTSSIVYRNDGNFAFTPVQEVTDTFTYARSAAWVDFDLDGYLDIFESTNAFLVGEDKIYLNAGADTFVDASPAFLGDGDVGRGHIWSDLDNDGDLDLFAASGNGCPCEWEAIPAYWIERALNRLFRNDGGGVFTDVTAGPIGVFKNSRGVAAGDYDNDGDLDLFIANLAIQGAIKGPKHQGPIGGGNQLLRNDGNLVFTDVTPDFMVEPEIGYRSAAWIDYDHDGDLDLHVMGLGSGNSRLFENVGPDGFIDAPDGSSLVAGSNGRAAGWADYDGDGDLDVYLTQGGKSTNRLMRNDLDNGKHWLQVELIGTESNRTAVGGRATVATASGSQLREVYTGSGYWAQHMLAMHFGLNDDTVIETLTARWPSGRKIVLKDVAIDQKLVLVEPDFDCPADLTGDSIVGFVDLLQILAWWGPCAAECPQDLDGDGEVGFSDLLAIIAAWGPCTG